MKKIFMTAIVLGAFVAGPPALASSGAQTLAEANATIATLQETIANLSAQIEKLQQELASLKSKLNIPPERTDEQYAAIFAKAVNAEVAVLSPNGGELFQASTTMPIRWTGKNLPNEGVITGALVNERGESTYILHAVPNSGSAMVLLPELAPGYYRLRLFCGIEGTDFYCSSDGTGATKKNAEDFSDGTFIITSAGPIPSGGGGGGGGGGGASAADTGSSGSGSGVVPAVTTVEMQSGNDYYFKGPATLQQVQDAGFTATRYPGNLPMQLLTFDTDELPEVTTAATKTHYIFDPGLRADGGAGLPSTWVKGWQKIGTGPTAYDPTTTKTTTYFIIRKDNTNADEVTFTIPAGVTYFGATPMNGSPRPW